MNSERDTLGKIQAYAVIFASVAVPFIVLYFTWITQSEIAVKQLDQDKLKLAIQVLSEESLKKDKNLSQWAKTVFDNTSKQIENPGFQHGPLDLSLDLPPSLLAAPLKWEGLEDIKTQDELLINYAINNNKFNQNVHMIKALQKLVILLNDSKKQQTIFVPNKSLNQSGAKNAPPG